MNNKEKLKELFGLALEIQMQGHATDADADADAKKVAYVSITASNYGTNVAIDINDDGFVNTGMCRYEFKFDDVAERTYRNCRSHLLDLLRKDLPYV